MIAVEKGLVYFAYIYSSDNCFAPLGHHVMLKICLTLEKASLAMFTYIFAPSSSTLLLLDPAGGKVIYTPPVFSGNFFRSDLHDCGRKTYSALDPHLFPPHSG